MKNLFLTLIIAETLILYYLAFIPYPPSAGLGNPQIKNYIDHFIAYLIYGLLAMGYSRYKSVPPLIGLIIFVSFSTEILQNFVPNRFMDFFDITVNLAGGFLGLSASRLYNFFNAKIKLNTKK